MRHLNFDLDLQFDDPHARWLSEQKLLLGMSILGARNVHYLREHPETPHLYDSGLVYKLPEQLERRPSNSQINDLNKFLVTTMRMSADEAQHHLNLARGVEIFRDIPRMFEHGGGDCDNMAGMRSAELVVAGEDCRPRMTCRQQGNRTIYHALVIWPDGSTEDPSLILGMGGPSRAAERREECRKNVERYDNYWQDAKRRLAEEDFPDEFAREARAAEYKAAIDRLGLIPKDGVFRVGRPLAGALPQTKPTSTRTLGLDVFAASRKRLAA